MLEFSGNVVDIVSYRKMWEKNVRPTVVYLHNPFCKTETNCGYCMHKGCPKNNHTEEEVQKFYFDYMPHLFKQYDSILKNQKIEMVDFGGGTPNYLPAEDFDKYLNSMPEYLEKAPRKIIELHPALITKDFINVLKKHNFTTLIFCFQTLDNDILREQGRLIPNYKNAFECMQYARDLEMNIAMDLITYWTTEDGWENTLRMDLTKIIDWNNFWPDELTVSVLYQNKYNNDNFNGISVYRKIRQIINARFPNYLNPENTLFDHYNVAATRVYKPDSPVIDDFNVYINSLSDMAWEHEQGYSTFGMGTYKNGDKAAYSMIGPDMLFYEEFQDFDRHPLIHQHRKWNFWDAARETINFYENVFNGENPPVATGLTLMNICQSKNLGIEQFDHFQQSSRCKHSWSPRITFSGKSEIERKFEEDFGAIVGAVDKNGEVVYNF